MIGYTWTEFIQVVTVALAGYYLYVLVRFYPHKITGWMKQPARRDDLLAMQKPVEEVQDVAAVQQDERGTKGSE